MTRFTPIDLSRLPAPDVIKPIGFEQTFDGMKQTLIERAPDLEPALELESELATKTTQNNAYHLMLKETEFNDRAKGLMLPFATGSTLDQLASFWGVERLTVQEADNTAIPAVPLILESDDNFRARVQLSLEGHTTAGSEGSYVFWAKTLSPRIKSVNAHSPAPGETLVTILTFDNGGIADADLLNSLSEGYEEIRPLCAQVTVQAAEIIQLEVEATLTFKSGPDYTLVLAAANEALRKYLDDNFKLGHDITISGIHAALHQEGVQNVNLTKPAADVVVEQTQAAYCDVENNLTLTIGGTDV